jgi:adenine phosphoribosyltransferase
MDLREKIRTVPNWPIKGVMFRDITTLIQDPQAFQYTCDAFYDRYKDMDLDKIVCIDARGFIFGAVLAYKLGRGCVMVRKKGKLPPETIQEEYSLEYGSNVIEISKHAIQSGDRVVIIDDLIATGGTIAAAANLVESLGGKVLECAFVIDLPDLKGKEKIARYPVFTLTEFEGE